MKKILLLLLTLVGVVGSVEAKTIYVLMGDAWKAANANLAICAHHSETLGVTWVLLTPVDGTNGKLYSAEIDNSYTYFNFVRLDNSGNTGWDYKWNQTQDISIATSDGIYYYKTSSLNNDNCEYISYGKSFSLSYGTTNSADGYTLDMTTENGLDFSVTLDNESAGATYYCQIKSDNNQYIFPNANSGEWILNFQNYSDALTTNNHKWQINGVKAKFQFTFNFGTWSWTCRPYFTRTISSLGYATFSSTYNVAVDGARATYITGVGANNVLTEVEFTDGIKANTGALLYKADGGTVTFTPAASTPTDVSSSNLLVAVSSDIDGLAQTDGSNTNYILTNKTTNGESSIGFYKANSNGTNTVAAGKAYLSLSNDIAPAREFFTFGEDIVTGIAAPKAVKNINGYYNLNGQRIAQPSKGLYIVNGKKVMVK